MAKRPKPVHQMTDGQFEDMSRTRKEACKAYWWGVVGQRAFIAPAVGTLRFMPMRGMGFQWQCSECEPEVLGL